MSGLVRAVFAGLLTVVLGFHLAPGAAAVGEYTVTDIGTLVGTGKGQFDILVNTVPQAINADGNVIANATGGGSGWTVPFTFQDGKLKRLGKEKAISSAEDINDNGEIAGWETSLDDRPGLKARAVVWRDGKPVELPTLGGDAALAHALNNKGEVVGLSEVTPGTFDYHPVLWQGDEVIDLGLLRENAGRAVDINESTVIIGNAHGKGGDLPLRWEDGTLEELPLPEGISSGTVFSINDEGTIVGSFNTIAEDASVVTAARWVNGEPELLASLIEDGPGIAVAINSVGQVVGWSALDADAQNRVAVLWQGEIVTDLNDLIPDDSGYTLTNARAINDAGQILVSANSDEDDFRHALLLSPVDEAAARIGAALLRLPSGAFRD
jgi:probable HAF family extracellular repeat protein